MATYKIVSNGGNGLPLNVETDLPNLYVSWKICGWFSSSRHDL